MKAKAVSKNAGSFGDGFKSHRPRVGQEQLEQYSELAVHPPAPPQVEIERTNLLAVSDNLMSRK